MTDAQKVQQLLKTIRHTEQTLAAALDFPKWGKNPVGADPEERMVTVEDVTLLAEMAAKRIKELRSLPVTGGRWSNLHHPGAVFVALEPAGMKREGTTLGDVWDANVKEKDTSFSYKEPSPLQAAVVREGKKAFASFRDPQKEPQP